MQTAMVSVGGTGPRMVIALLAAAVLTGCATNHTSEGYKPVRAQHGKDVMWIPTPDTLVLKMLEMAQVSSNDMLYDLGAGDGKIPIEAARRFGATAVGIEYNPEMAEYARENVRKAGVSDKVTIVTGDIFQEDFSSADVLTLYLLESLNVKLKPTILAMKPGTRVVSNSFRMGAWQPDDVVTVENGWSAYLWIVPARVQGAWKLSGSADAPAGVLEVKQILQQIEGTFTPPGSKPVPVAGRVAGTRVYFRSVEGYTPVIEGAFDVPQGQSTASSIARRIP